MKQEFFIARLLQIQLEMEAWKTKAIRYQRDDMPSRYFEEAEGHLEALGRGIDNLINEYSKGEETPAVSTMQHMNAIYPYCSKNKEAYMAWCAINHHIFGKEVEDAGKKERLYTLNEMHRSYMQGRSFCHLSETDGSAESNFESFIESLEGAGE